MDPAPAEVDPPTTRFLILAVSLALVVCGLIVTGALPIPACAPG